MAEIEQIPSPTGQLVARISDGWVPSLPHVAKPKSLVIGETDVTSFLDYIHLSRTRLDVHVRGMDAVRFVQALMDTPTAVDVRGEFDDGWALTARALASHLHFGDEMRGKIRCFQWSFRRLGRPGAQYWLSRIEQPLPSFASNLRVIVERAEGKRIKMNQLALRGAHLEHFLLDTGTRGDSAWYLLSRPLAPPADLPARISEDVAALSFTFGRWIGCSALQGIDAEGTSVEFRAFGIHSEDSDTGHDVPPVPIDQHDSIWAAALFPCVSAITTSQERARTAISYFVESARGHVDGRYLFLRIALEVLSRTVLASQRPTLPQLAQDADAWNGFIDSIATPATTHAATGFEEVLITQLRHATLAPSSVIVEQAFGTLGLVLTPDIRDEVQRWDDVLTTGTISRKRPRDIQSDMRRVMLLRSMFAGMMARYSGYGGPVLAKSSTVAHPEYGPLDALSSESLRDAKRVFTVTESLHDIPPEGYWPEFFLPPPPETPLLRTIRDFASELESRTSQRIAAQLRYAQSGGDHAYDLVIGVTLQPALQALLFTIVPHADQVVIRNWSEDDLTLSDEESLRDFLRTVAQSDSVRQRVASLLVASQVDSPREGE